MAWEGLNLPEGHLVHFSDGRHSGDAKMHTDNLTCSVPWAHTEPALLACTHSFTMWVFHGDRYTRTALYGLPVGGDPNIEVAHGTCVKF